MGTDFSIHDFLVACANSGLFPRNSLFQQHIAEPSVSSVLRRTFERRAYRVRHPLSGDLPVLVEIETACWPGPLRTPAEELAARISRFPSGQLVAEMEGRVVGAIYSQRIAAAGPLKSAMVGTVSSLHRDDGPVVQLLAVNILPAVQDLGLGDQLLDFMLQYCSALPGIEGIVAVSLCKEYPRHHSLPLEEYIHLRDEEGHLKDPILRFHEAHGGRIAGLCRGYRPLDHDNRGNGVLVEYGLPNRAAGEVPEQSRGAATSGGEAIAGPVLPLVEECIRRVMGEGKGWSFSPSRPLMEMGFDSLKLMELRALLGRRLAREIDSAFFFRYGTPERIARFFEGGGAGDSEAAEPVRSQRKTPAGSRKVPEQGAGTAGDAFPERAVAIIGMACRLPGGVDNPDAFWELLRSGTDAVTEIPKERWEWDRWLDPDPEKRGEFLSRHGGFIRDVDMFDAPFFTISPREAHAMDPQHRLLLTCAWEAIERAGMDPTALAGTRTGVFAGLFSHDYETLRHRGGDRAAIDPSFATGNAASMAAGRLAYFFGFAGPALAVDTACSSSLVAVHLACRSLRTGETDIALASGVNLLLSPELTVAFSRAGMLSPTGRCRTFDASADGYVRSEGCGVVVLKLLSRALADGDPLWAVLRGSAINQDGASNGLTAPNGLAQETVMREALADAGVDPGEVSYVEAHGTGTAFGDPVEVASLVTVYGRGRTADNPLFLGSVKANIGHAEAAAGIAGLIKVVLAMRHRRIPAQLHFREINPQIALPSVPLTIPVQCVSWDAVSGRRRLAGVSSFGFSGTNAHVVVEEAPETQCESGGPERPLHLLALSAGTEEALERLAKRYESFLDSSPEGRLADICYTANAGRAHFSSRMGIVAASPGELREKLRSRTAGEGEGVFRGDAPAQPKVAFLFTGQGAQFAGMARELSDSQPTFRESLARCEELLDGQLDCPLFEAIYPREKGDPHRVDQTAFTQPALFSLEYALCSLWQSWGVQPAAALGHSVGEYAAACAAGVFSLEEGLGLIAARGRLMQALAQDGAMAAVFAGEPVVADAIAPFAQDIAIAALNGPRMAVISGRADSVGKVMDALASQGIRVARLNVSHAFHSPLMEPVLGRFGEAARGIRYASPRIDLISNLTGDVIGDEIASADYWVRHARGTVRFSAGIESLYRRGYRIFIEIGPQPVLAGMGKAFLPDDCTWLPSLQRGRSDWEQMLRTLGALYSRGVQIDWRGFDADYCRQKTQVPTYPFAGQRYWLKEPKVGGIAREAAPLAIPRERDRDDQVIEDLLYRVEWCRQAGDPDKGPNPLPSPAGLRERLVPLAAQRVEPLPDLLAALEALSLSYVQQALKEMGWDFRPGSRFTTAAAAGALAVADKHRPLFGRLLGILAEEGFLYRDAERWEVRKAWGRQEPEPQRRGLRARYPRADAELTMLGRCGGGLAGVLRGELDPLSLLFPEADLTTAARLYEDSPTFGAMNRLVGDAVAALLDQRGNDRQLRILEIGAGTGGTTAAVLPHLKGKQAEYTFTDVSALFLTRARERFADDSLHYRLLDVEKDPLSQGFEPHGYDVILAANVLHATRELRVTVRRVRELLAPGGMVVLLEGIEHRRWLDLIFGLLDGWWKFRDHDLRPSHPLMAAAAWEALLRESGFAETACVAPGQGLFSQAVILASAPSHDNLASLPEQQRWLICCDASGVGRRLAGLLRGRGDEVTTVDPGKRFARTGNGGYTVRPAEPEDLRCLLAAATAGEAALHRVVHLWGLDTPEPGGAPGGDAGSVALNLCTGLLHLVQALTEREGARPSLTVVTRHAVRTDGERAGSELAQAPLWGLAQVISAEHPELNCRRIDMEGGAEEAELLSEEILRPGREEQIALRHDGRYAARLVPWGRGADKDSAAPRIRPDSSYLITGGLGGTGLEIAGLLAKRGAGQVVLLGRSGRPAAGTAAAEALRCLENTGAKIMVLQADVAQKGEIQGVLSAIRESGMPLAGVVHAAGVFEDRLLAGHAADLFARVFSAKVQGAWNLHELTKEMPLDFFVLFSSVTSFLCSSGLGNYVAANAFLDALAHERRSIGLTGLSIGWGPWTGTGMAAAVGRTRRLQWAARGLSTLAPGKALAVFERLLGYSGAQVAVMPMDWQLFFRSTDGGKRPAFFERIPDRRGRELPEGESFPATLRKAPTEHRRELLRTHLVSLVATVLGVNRASVDIRRGLFQMGMDSLTAMELRNRLQREFSCTLAATLIFRYPTVEALAEYLLGSVVDSGAAPPAADARPEAARVGENGSGNGEAASVDSLSDGEAEARLLKKLEALRY
ncbi:MAG: SDR family NAD(P)-dependent oxidoreductase [Deltaproteobacteria bacterium]|nr:SDR family NAD(P)-dependent oxidoreductase [Deltaproteobacteria bacterium]